MAVPIDMPVLCPVLIGRAASLEALVRLLADAAGGRGCTVTVSGEAGIGKSRLVAEARSAAVARGFTVVQGNCFETDRVCPYAPIVDLLRAFCDAHPPSDLVSGLGPSGGELLQLVPELRAWGVVPVDRGLAEPEQEKRRLFHALVGFLLHLADHAPLLVVLEDLHWCDDTSLEWLLYLARAIATRPVAVLLTVRSDEISPALQHTLAALDRSRLAAELSLVPLDRPEVDAMLQAIFGLQRPSRDEFLDAIHTLTGGNPFFIEEVLRALVAAGGIYRSGDGWSGRMLSELQIPRSVRDTVLRRRAGLSTHAVRALEIASVGGQRVDYALLQRLTGYAEDEMLRSLKELIAAQLLVERSPEQFSFRHALTREAIYADLLGRERRALHRTVAEAMEVLNPTAQETNLADLAYHYQQAGVWQEALRYARLAGERAQRLYAPRAAVDQFSRALDAAAHLAAGQPPDLYRARGKAHETLGAWESAHQDYQAALTAARGAGDRPAEWDALLDLGMLWAGRDYDRTRRYYQQAAALAAAAGDQALIAHSHNRIGNWHLNVDQPLEAREHHQAALGIFEQLDDRRGIAATLDFLGMTSFLGADLLRGTGYYRQAVALFRELDDQPGLTSALATLTLRGATIQTDSMVLPGTRARVSTLAECTADGAEALQVARAIGNRSAEAYAQLMLGFCLGGAGSYGRALAAAEAGREIAVEIEHRQWMAAAACVFGYLHLDMLDVDAAVAELERGLSLARDTGSSHWVRVASGLLASAAITRRDHARAEAVLDAAGAPTSAPLTLGARLVWCARDELALARKQPEAALGLLDQLEAVTPSQEEIRHRSLRLLSLRGTAMAALGHPAEAALLLDAARDLAGETGAHPMLWRIEIARGALALATGRRQTAAEAHAAAVATVETLAGSIPSQHRQSFRAAARALIPGGRVRTGAAAPGPGGLTAREREVATLVARGCSNREIAAALYVGERTVETHVSNIMAKLGCEGRARIAAWAVQQGLG